MNDTNQNIDNQNQDLFNIKFTFKDFLIMVYAFIAYAVVCAAIAIPIFWLLSKCLPLLIGAIVFIPWFCSALKEGRKL